MDTLGGAIGVLTTEAYVNAAVKTFTNLACALLLVWDRLKANVALLGQFGNVLKLVMQRDFQGAFDESKRIMADVGANSLAIMSAPPMAKSVGDAWNESKATASDYLSYIKTGWETAKQSIEKYKLAASAIVDLGTGKGAVAGLSTGRKNGGQGRQFPAFNSSVDATQGELWFKRELLALDIKRSEINGNFRLNEAEKYRANLALLRDEPLLLQERDAFLQNAARLETDPKKKNALLGKIDANAGEMGKTNASISALGPFPDSFFEQWDSKVASLSSSFGTMAQQVAGSLVEVIGSAINSVSNGITGLIMGTNTWAQFLSEIPTQILTSIVRAIVQLGVRWIATQILMATAGNAILAANLAATAPIAMAQSLIWATPATLATIASYGSAAAAPGMIGLAQGIVAAQSLLAFAEGGMTPGRPSMAIVSEQEPEFVIPARATAALGRDNLGMLRSGQLPAVAVPSAAAGMASAPPQINQTLLLALDPAPSRPAPTRAHRGHRGGRAEEAPRRIQTARACPSTTLSSAWDSEAVSQTVIEAAQA